MASASTIRLQIEAALAHRIPSALTPVPRLIRPVAPTGVAAVDDLLGGGLPIGTISEFVGPECSGRTSLAYSFLARLTGRGSGCAWIDVCNGFDPESAAAAHMDLARLLWVRCGVPAKPDPAPSSERFHLPDQYFVAPPVKKGLHGGGFGPHPRTEANGLSEAVNDLLRTNAHAPRCAEAQGRVTPERGIPARPSPHPIQASPSVRTGKPWSRMEQALRVTDLLLQVGGFAAIVLDMGSLAAEHATRVPLATWFRYRTAAEKTQAALLLLTQYSCAKSSGELLLRFQPGQSRSDEDTVFTGMECRVEVERRRFTQASASVVPIRKPLQREPDAHWRTRSTWAGAR